MFTPKDAVCPSCGATYWKEQAWKRVCLDCYIDVKRAEEGLPPRDRTAKAKPKQEKYSNFNSDEFFKKFRQQHQATQPPIPGLDREMLRRLIQLCHPDKHGGSVAANTATQWLLKLKV